MRSLKTFAVSLIGLIAAVFGFVLHSAPAAPLVPTTVDATDGLRADLPAKRLTPAGDTIASRDAKLPGKAPQPQPHVPFYDFSRRETPRVAHYWVARALPWTPVDLIDRRQSLLVGVVELRI